MLDKIEVHKTAIFIDFLKLIIGKVPELAICNWLCKTKNGSEKIKAICTTNNVGHCWTWGNCKSKNINRVYEGETSHSAMLRGKEFLQGLKNKNESNMLYKHKMLEHTEEENIQVKMEITCLFEDALTRQAIEAVCIKKIRNVIQGHNVFTGF